MKVGFHVSQDAGLESAIFGHFASAPLFITIDTDTDQSTGFANCDPLAPDDGCNALKAVCFRGQRSPTWRALGFRMLTRSCARFPKGVARC